jgi:hypothetical protein
VASKPEREQKRRRVDRGQAFQYWASLPVDARAYAAVAREFGISPRTVERYARDGSWRERLRRIDAEAAARADQDLGRKRAQQLADFQQLIEAICVTYARQLASGEVRITASEFVGLIKAHLLLQGEPAARVEPDRYRPVGRAARPDPAGDGRLPGGAARARRGTRQRRGGRRCLDSLPICRPASTRRASCATATSRPSRGRRMCCGNGRRVRY